MIKGNRLLSAVLALALLCTLLPMGILSSSADSEGDFTYTLSEDGTSAYISGYTGKGGDVVIPATLGGATVSTVDYDAFKGQSAVTSISIPADVWYVSAYAFEGCTNLQRFVVDEDNISYYAQDGVLFDRDSLELVRYPAGNPATSYTIPDGVTAIGGGAFDKCTHLTGVTIPSSVTTIGYGAFVSCTALTGIAIPEGVTAIGFEAFAGCTALANISLPRSLVLLSGDAFANTAAEKDQANWENNILYVDKWAMAAPTDVTATTLREGTVGIASFAFSWCDELTTFTLPEGLTIIGQYAFSNCTALTNITLPSTLISIQDSAFEDCNALADIIIPDSVTYVGDCVFEETAIYTREDNWENGLLYVDSWLVASTEEVSSCTVREGTVGMADYALGEAEELTDITIPASVLYMADHALGFVYDCTIYGYRRSAAQQYAKEHFLTFVPLDSAALGDVDGNDKVNTTDARLTLQFAAGRIDESKLDTSVADVDGNDKVNTTDARLILQRAAGRIDKFPVEE